MVDVDEWLCSLPFFGRVIGRLYAYFRRHTAFTDLIHVSLGLGIGLALAGLLSGAALVLGALFVAIGILGHAYAFIKGGS